MKCCNFEAFTPTRIYAMCNSFSIVNETPIVMKDLLRITHVSNVTLKMTRRYWDHSNPIQTRFDLV